MTDTVNVGTAANSGNGDPLRVAFQLINAKLSQQETAIRDGLNNLGVLLVSRGEWAASTAYTVTPNREWVISGGVAYAATVNHTSGASFAADLAAGKWIAIDAAQLGIDLSADTGAALVGYGSTTVAEAIPLDPRKFGAVPNTGDNAAALAAFFKAYPNLEYPHTGDIRVSVPGDFPTLQKALDSVAQKNAPDGVWATIDIAAGIYENTVSVFAHGDLSRIRVNGLGAVEMAITGMASVTGISGAYDVTFNVASTAGISVGHFAMIRGEDYPASPAYPHEPALHGAHWGVWKITAVGAGTFTVRNTCRAAGLAVSAVTGATVTIIKTVLRFTDCNGVVVESGAVFGGVDNLVIEGVSGVANRNDYGLLIGSHRQEDTTYHIRPGTAACRVGRNFGASGWRRSGCWTGYGASMYLEGGSMSCNNGEHGFEADTAASIVTGFYELQPVANGNNGCGFLSYNGSGIWAGSYPVACGNNLSGIAAQTSSGIVLGNRGALVWMNRNGVASEGSSGIEGERISARYNSQAGLRSVGASSISGTGNRLTHNGTYGAYSASGSNLVSSLSEINNNVTHGVHVDHAWGDVGGSTSSDNGQRGYSCVGGTLRAVSCYASGNADKDYKAERGGKIDAQSSKGVDAVTGASYEAISNGYIYAYGAVTTGSTFLPPANTVGRRGSVIHLNDEPYRQTIDVRSISLSSTSFPTYAPNLDSALYYRVTYTGTAWGFIAPTNAPAASFEFILEVKNGNGSTAVAPTFSAEYVMGTAAASISAGNSSMFRFIYNGTKYICSSRLENVTI